MPSRISPGSYTQSAQLWTNKPSDAIDGHPKPSSILFSKTPPTKLSATSQSAGTSDGGRVGQGSLVDSLTNNPRMPSGDDAKNQPSTMNVYGSQDTTAVSSGVFNSMEPYPREVWLLFCILSRFSHLICCNFPYALFLLSQDVYCHDLIVNWWITFCHCFDVHTL